MEEAENEQIVNKCQIACLGKNSLLREILVLRSEELEKSPPLEDLMEEHFRQREQQMQSPEQKCD